MRVLRLSIFTFALLALIFLARSAQADSVMLENGDRLSGTLISLDSGTLVLKTPYAGTVKLPWSKVTRIESDAPIRLRLKDQREYDGRLVMQDGRLAIALTGLKTTTPLPLDTIVAINPPRNPDKTVLSGHLSAGGNLSRGNTSSTSLHFAGEVITRNPQQQITLGGEVNEAEQDGVNTASNWRVGLKYDHFLSTTRYLYVNTGFARDKRADLDLRSTLGAGGGTYLIDNGPHKLSVEGGLSLVYENYGNAADENFPSARLAARYDRALLNDRLVLFHTSEILLNLDNTEDLLYLARTGVRLPVSQKLSLTLQANLDYDTLPAAGKESTDTAVIMGVDYKL
jgi:putative salt-induced outer membrane protein YdiY